MTFKRLLPLTLSLLAFSLPLAQAAAPNQSATLGPNITRTYTTAQLSTQAGLLQIGKDELWMLNFPDTVTDVLTTRDGVLDTKMMGNTVALAAILNSGQLPLAIKLANGVTQYFLVTLSASRGGAIKNIVVTDASATEAAAPVSTVTPQPTTADANTRSYVQPGVVTAPTTSRPSQAGLSAKSAAVPPAAVLPITPPATAPQSALQAPPMTATPVAQTSVPGLQLPLQAQFAVQQDGTALVLYYRLNNPSGGAYLLNDQQLHVSSGSQLLSTNGRGPLTLAPGANTYGTVMLSAAGVTPGTPLAVEWSAVQQSTGIVTVLRSFVEFPQALSN